MSQHVPESQNRSIEILGHDILHQICQIFIERTPNGDRYNPKLLRPSLPGLVAFSATNKAMREIAKPMIFEEVVITQDFGRGEGSWEKAVEKLEVLLSEAGGILEYVKNFEFSIKTGYASKKSDFPSSTPYLLMETLSQLPKLQQLTFVIPPIRIKEFAEVFAARRLRFPKVEKVVVGSSSEFVVAAAPNARSVWTSMQFGSGANFWPRASSDVDVGLDLVNAVLQLEGGRVEEVKIVAGWSLEMVRALAANPNSTIKSISRLAPPQYSSGSVPTSLLIKHLSPLLNLEEITLANAAELEMGYCPPWCGNAYQGRSGFELHLRLIQQLKEVESQIINMVEDAFGEGRKMRRVQIGEDTVFERKEVDVGGEEDMWRVGKWVRAKRSGDVEKQVVYYDSDDEKGGFLGWREKEGESE